MNYLWYYLTAPFRSLSTLPARMVGAPQRLMGMSLPARVAILMFIFLVILVITAFLAFYFGDSDPIWREWLRASYLIPILLLAAVIPVLTYYTLRLWLAGEVAEFPEIEVAWREGLRELEREGIDVQAAPLFVVLGVHDPEEADSLMEASELRLRVQGFPDRRTALRWYAREDAVFLFCTQVGAITAMQQHVGGAGASWSPGPSAPSAGGITGTLITGGGITGTSTPGASGGSNSGLGGGSSPAGGYGGASALQGTLMPGTDVKAVAGAPAASLRRGLAPGELDECSARLGFLCRLIQQARQPYCPLNGILTVLDWTVLEEVLAAEGLATAIRRDLVELHRATEMSCPVTTLVAGMEQESGFAELVRRVGSESAGQGRFGKGFDVWNRPSAENLDALSSHACGAFEDWVYSLFRDPQSLHKPGNGKLYGLMCKIRGEIQIRLRNILVRGYAWEEGEAPGMRLSGCYFAATGRSPDQRAFVKSVLHKMSELEGELDWSDSAWNRNGRHYTWARMGMALDGLLLLAVAAMLIYHFALRGGGR